MVGNMIGLDKAGLIAVPNGYGGIGMWGAANSNVIGGADQVARNIVSGNLGSGIAFSDTGTNGNRFIGNWIGINKSGDPVGNTGSGVSLYDGPSLNEIGASLPGEGNIIAASGSHGVVVWTGATTGNKILGNFIGVDRKGRALGNEGIGIYTLAGASSTQIGGTVLGEGNVIRGNGSYGILLAGSGNLGSLIGGNSISNNLYDGIALSTGANQNLAKPVLTSAALGMDLVVNGTIQLNGQNLKQVVVEFFSSTSSTPTGFEQGEVFLGRITTSTNSSGSAPLSVTLKARKVKGTFVTATVRLLSSGDTSGFSNAVAVTTSDSDNDGIPNAWENSNGLNANSSADTSSDLDGDGFTNLQEFYFGTNPRNSQSKVSLLVSSEPIRVRLVRK